MRPTGQSTNPQVSKIDPMCQTGFELLAENPCLKTPGGFSFWRVGLGAAAALVLGKAAPHLLLDQGK